MSVQEFHYRIGWRARGRYPGHHRAAAGGGGFEFHSHAPLLAVADPRRLDIRASLRDPFGQWVARVHHQRSSVPLYVLADLSASMGFRGRHAKLEVLADLVAAAGYSAARTGDPFGFIGADERVREELLLPATRARGAGAGLARRLRAFAATGASAAGLLEASRYLGRTRALVLLISDFHLPLALVSALRDRLVRHDVVPVVLWDPLEAQGPGTGAGLVRLRDRESGSTRTLLLRASLRARLAENYAEHRRALQRAWQGRGREPLFLDGPFRADALTRYFFGDASARAPA
ncbi:MAG TPA: DUF58 domain-containing protein [Burkholderiales bacterium]